VLERFGERGLARAVRYFFILLVAWEGINPAVLRRAEGQATAILEAKTPSATIAGKLRLLYEVWRPERLRRFDGPALLVRGGLDALSTGRSETLLAGVLPRLERHVVGWTGHAMHIARLGTVARLIHQFTARLPAVLSSSAPLPREAGPTRAVSSRSASGLGS
jgi:pimeloyl-ACP methyl ester carboxylesterase